MQVEFERRYLKERPMYARWGAFVARTVIDSLAAGGQRVTRLPPLSRTKAVDSLVGKAFYRGKNYPDPYNDITDKVGTRFVVLLVDEIRDVERAIVSCEAWTAAKDRDFEEERKKAPTHFTYQSLHYVVRAQSGVQDEEGAFPEGIPCEIQIRTLLQHAFSELTHDTVYKPHATMVPDVHRDLAKSMALIEVADTLFQAVSMTFMKASEPIDVAIAELERIYREQLRAEPATDLRANTYLLSELFEMWEGVSWEAVREFAASKPLERWVGRRAEIDFLFRQPAITLVYYLAARAKITLSQSWPLLDEELGPIFADLGEAPPYN